MRSAGVHSLLYFSLVDLVSVRAAGVEVLGQRLGIELGHPRLVQPRGEHCEVTAADGDVLHTRYIARPDAAATAPRSTAQVGSRGEQGGDALQGLLQRRLGGDDVLALDADAVVGDVPAAHVLRGELAGLVAGGVAAQRSLGEKDLLCDVAGRRLVDSLTWLLRGCGSVADRCRWRQSVRREVEGVFGEGAVRGPVLDGDRQ